MKKIIISLALVFAISSCVAQTRSGVSSAFLVTSWDDTISGSVNNSVEVRKKGTACTVNVLGIVSVGDSSIEAAKRDGSITKVAFADTTYFNIFFGLFQRGCTVVKGE